MRVDSWLRTNTHELDEAGVPSARLDCLLLLEDVSGHDRAWLLAHPEYELPSAALDTLDKNVTRRIGHEPLAYIRGKTEFYGREYYVDQHVLEPRPETETMISRLKALELPEAPVIIDLGTGSGALAITAKLEIPAAEVYATDIDSDCLDTAQRNAKALGADISTRQADLLVPVDGQLPEPDIILANLPYVPDDFEINLAAGHEPQLAIFGGPDGLDLYRRLFGSFTNRLVKLPRPAYVLTEALPPQHQTLAAIARDSGYKLLASDDFIQIFVPA